MPPRKRQAAAPAAVPTEPSGRRRSARASTGKTSSYFDNSDGEAETGAARPAAKRARTLPTAGSGAKRARRQADEADEDSADDYKDEAETEDDGDELGDDDDDDDDDDAAPRVTFTPHKQLRSDGGIAYEPGRLHPNTLLFLRDLQANNRRNWLKENDAEFRRAQADWHAYVEILSARLSAEADETVPELPVQDVVFRVYRDIRFSKDPTPYKPYFSAAWSRTGRKGPYACYYLHCQPGACLLGGGLWHPDAASLALLRASIDERPQRWRRALAADEPFRRTFLSSVPKAKAKAAKGAKGARGARGAKAAEQAVPAGSADEAAALHAFASLNTHDALKTKPKGFDASHRDIELLKLRNFTVTKKLADDIVTDPDGQDRIIDMFKSLSGFVHHLNRIVRPDPGDDDESDEQNEETDGNSEDDGGDEEEDEDQS